MHTSSLYNNVKPFPKNGNLIGIDKLILDFPYSINLENKLQLADKVLNVSDDTGVINYSIGKLVGNTNVEVQIYKNYIRFTLNPVVEIYGSNFYTLSKEEVFRYLIRLQRDLDIDIFKGIIRRLDLQSTLKMIYNPASYFEVLGRHRNLIKSNILGSTLYYNSISKTKYKTLLFYDKSKREGKNTPLEFEGGNYLRYEAQYYNKFLKEVVKKLGKETLTIQDLFDDEINNKLMEYWYEDYQSIYKEQKAMFNANNINKPSDIDKILASEGIKAIGSVEEVCKMIEAGLLMTDKKPPFKSKVKGRVKNIASSDKVIVETPFLEELDSKINEAFSNTISSELT